jgi:hypothetical protein
MRRELTVRTLVRGGVATCVVLLAAFSGCTTLLGDFTSGDAVDGGATDSGPLADGPTAASCTGAGAPACGAHGTCAVDAGVASCTCAAGYTGANCTTCATGYQEDGDAGVCTSTCAMAMLTCGAHEACVDSNGPAHCACVTGYSISDGGTTDGGGTDAGSACAFTGGPLDPTFQNMPPAWQTLDAGAVIEADAMVGTGQLDPGFGDFGHAPLCTPQSKIQQTFDMPTVAQAEPLELKVSAAIDCGDCVEELRQGSLEQLAIAFGEGYVPTQLAYASQTFNVYDICLGDRAFGPGVNLSFSSWQTGGALFCSDPASDIYIDHASIEPSTTCPAANTVLNGNFESPGGWTADGMASVKPNIGVGGSTAGELDQATSTDYAALTGTMSPPFQSIPQAALTFTYNGTNGLGMNVQIGSRDAVDIALVTGTATFDTATICIPEWAKGVPVSLTFQAPYNYPTVTQASDFVVDNVAFGTDARCPVVADIIDSGFERTDPGSGWALNEDYSDYGYVSYTTVSANVHGGARALQINMEGPCAGPSVQTTVTVPDSVGAAGPAVKFWYKTDPYANGVYFTAFVGQSNVMLPAESAWTQQTMCLPPTQPGRGYNFELYGSTDGGTCASTFAPVNGYFDDVTVTTDATCPTQ